MKNKFVEFLLDTQLNNITYQLINIDTEYVKKQSSVLEEYPYIDGLFDFLNEHNISLEETYSVLKRSKASVSLSDILVGESLQNDIKRLERFNTFRPLLRSNINFYKETISVCLKEHQYIKDPFNTINKTIFNELLEIGIEKNHLKHFSREEIQTTNKEYKKILIEKDIFEQKYDIKETIKLLDHKNLNNKNILNHFSMYSEDIYNLLENLNLENLNDFKQQIIESSNISQQYSNSIQNTQVNNIINYLISNCIEIEKEKFSPLLKSGLIRSFLIDIDSYSNKALGKLIEEPKLLEEFIDNTNNSENIKLFKMDNYIDGVLILKLNKNSTKESYMTLSLLPKILEKIDFYNHENMEKLKKEALISKLLFNSAEELKNTETINTQFEKYKNYIIKSLVNSCANNLTLKDNEKFQLFNKVENCISSTLFKKIKSKIASTQKYNLYIFTQQFKKDKKMNNFNILSFVEQLENYISTTQDFDVLNIVNLDSKNPDWKILKFEHTNGKSYIEDNLMGYMIKKTNQPVKMDLIKWLINESPDNFYDVKFGSKDILSYFSKEKNMQEFFVTIVDHILSNETSFNKILKDNKNKMKLVNSIENETIEKKLNYYKLKSKIGNSSIKSESIVKTKNKI